MFGLLLSPGAMDLSHTAFCSFPLTNQQQHSWEVLQFDSKHPGERLNPWLAIEVTTNVPPGREEEIGKLKRRSCE